jgi:hypothetical protein
MTWVAEEFRDSYFADLRLKERFIKFTSRLSDNFGESIPMACQDWSATKAAYRFLDNDRVCEDDILAGHFSSTAQRFMDTCGPILVLHDTTEFTYTREKNEIGSTRKLRLGNPGRDFVGRKIYHTACGVLMHTTLALTPEGIPLGLGAVKFWTRKDFKGSRELKKKINPTRVPIEEKESFRWLENIRKSTERFGEPERCIHVADREADMYEYFHEAKRLKSHFLVRICVDRRTTEIRTVDEEMRRAPVAGRYAISFTDEQGKHVDTELEVKFKTLEIKPSDGRKAKIYGPLKVSVIYANEIGRKSGRSLINWKLITDLPVKNLKAAVEKLRWYALRWKIEVFFKILKSGCKAEDSKLRTSARLSKLISIFCVLGWRVFWMTMINREIEAAPAEIALTDEETAILDHIFPPRKKNQTLSDYIIKVARLGGYLARSSDPPPGNQVMWRGVRRLTEIHLGIEIGRNFVGN